MKIYKAVINGGFSCPNIDGNKGIGGCIFCSGGSGYFTNSAIVPIKEQVRLEIERIHKKTPGAKVMAYFQAHTNTYAPVKKLKMIYDEALSASPYICGISIGTRPDCLDDEIIKYLAELSNKTNLTIELGLQSIHDKTAKLINRCYPYEMFLATYQKLKDNGIRVCVHLIDGLPYETHEMMMESAKNLGKLRPDAVKIQLLHIINGTRLEKMYLDGVFNAMEKEEYINLVAHQLEYMPPETVIERITGDGDRKTLIAPLWSIDKISVLGGIDKVMATENLWQGRLFTQE